MRKATALVYLCLSALSTAIVLNFERAQQYHPISDIRLPSPLSEGVQMPIDPGIVQPPEDQDNDGATSGLAISDILPKTRSVNIFASLTRDVSAVSDRLGSSSDNTTLLAPLNSAMANLPRKPWEDPPWDTSDVKAASNQGKAAQNIQRFVEEHVVPVSPWKSGKENKVKSLGGKELWWEERNGKKVVLPDEVVVDGVLGRVGNGEVWSLKGVVNYA